MMPRLATVVLSTSLAFGAAFTGVAAQQVQTGPPVGQAAPDFALTGATRYGVLRDQVKLSDFRGQTVVLAFFFKARTKG